MNVPTQQRLKDVAALKQKKARDESGLILVEGRHPIEEALRAGLNLKEYFVMADSPPASLPNAPLSIAPQTVDEKTMHRLSCTSSPPPCLGVFECPPPVRQLQGDLILLLDGIQDPGNLGTLVRSALAFGVDSVVLTGNSTEPWNPKVIRASAGLIFALPILECTHDRLPELFAGTNWRIYTTTGAPDALPYREADYREPCVLVLGNEGRGVSPALFADKAVQPLTIPMATAVESLNVAISGSIILAEAAAQRREAPHA